MKKQSIKLTVNNIEVCADVEPRTLLVDFLRDVAATKGVRIACEEGACGACTVHINGKAAKSCLVLVARLDGATVTTVEGLAQARQLNSLTYYIIIR